MQMARTTLAIDALKTARLPYVVVLTDPTTGGVTASYGMLGDVHLAEPGALIGFTGPRIIEQTIRETLPAGFQRSEYLEEKGMVDKVVHRKDLRTALGTILMVLMSGRRPPHGA
jgi:acetyl-CoA carboxylase carboxyl transferase subunit beta